MIYESVPISEPIRQGDIFLGVPRFEIDLKKMILYDEKSEKGDGESLVSWKDIFNQGENSFVLPFRPVNAIVITQDCDTQRERDISLCEIRNFSEVSGLSIPASSSAWPNWITKQSRTTLKWFYLPPDPSFDITKPSAVDFLSVLCLPRIDLEDLRFLRKGRLNLVADEHFREKLSEFFRRYPYDEWYPLNQAEYAEYKKKPGNENTPPYPWQE